MALRFGCPIVPTRLERTRGAHFRVTVHPPILPTAEPDFETAVVATVRRVNEMLEAWIRDRPDQWLWLHRRWSD
jgi:KDO2-lipid IV(A) lauroyltransferase